MHDLGATFEQLRQRFRQAPGGDRLEIRRRGYFG